MMVKFVCKFYIVEDKKWKTQHYRNGNVTYGFASSDDDELDEYVKSLFNDSEIKREIN